jgi:hypothetical protein
MDQWQNEVRRMHEQHRSQHFVSAPSSRLALDEVLRWVGFMGRDAWYGNLATGDSLGQFWGSHAMRFLAKNMKQHVLIFHALMEIQFHDMLKISRFLFRRCASTRREVMRVQVHHVKWLHRLHNLYGVRHEYDQPRRKILV